MGATVVVAGIILETYALLSHSEAGSEGHMDMGSGRNQVAYSSAHVILAIVGAVTATAGASYLLIETQVLSRRTYPEVECLPKDYYMEMENPARNDQILNEEEIVLRLLTGDERSMYRTLIESNGEALQKDLINRTKLSNAMMTRVLDRLKKGDLIVGEGYGSTNRVKIKT